MRFGLIPTRLRKFPLKSHQSKGSRFEGASGRDQVARRLDILDLDTRDLDVPIVGGVVHDLQQAMIDFVSLRQEFVQIHRAHNRADHDQIEDGGR